MPNAKKITSTELFTCCLARHQIIRIQNCELGQWLVAKPQGLFLSDEEIDFGKYEQLYTGSNGSLKNAWKTYLCCQDNGMLVDDREEADDWELFHLIIHENNIVSLISFHKTYWSAQGKYVICKPLQKISNRERWKIFT